MTGSGNSIFSSMTSSFSSQSVSPVVVFFSPIDGSDVTGVEFFDFLAVIGVHQDDAADAFLNAFGGIDDKRTAFEGPE
jgi:hypothetical protein